MSAEGLMSSAVGWPRVIHIGAWALVVMVASQWLSVNHHKLLSSLQQAESGALSAIDDALKVGVSAQGPTVAAGSTLSSQEVSVLDALAVKSGKKALSAEESAMLSAAIARMQGAPAPPETSADEIASARDEAMDSVQVRHSKAFFDVARPAVTFSSFDLVFGAVSVAGLLLAVWRLRQALLAVSRWGLESDRAYRRYDQIFQALAAACGLKVSIDTVLGMLGLYPSAWPQPGGGGEFIILALALFFWLGAPRLIRWRPKRLSGRRELEAQLAEARAKADALAQENSQFI